MDLDARIDALILHQKQQKARPESYVRWGQGMLILLLGWWTVKLMMVQPTWIFLDNVNLLFHEAGHLIFGLLGETMAILGGTLMQILVPILVMVEFSRRKHWYGAGFGVWWLGENLVNVAVYMKDARAQVLPLLGSGLHDWWSLFSQWGVLEYDQVIGNMVFVVGIVVMAGGLILLIGLITSPQLTH